MLGDAFQKVGILLALMGLVSLLEIWIPLRKSNGRGVTVNLALTALFFALNLLVTLPLLLAAEWLFSRGMGLLPMAGLGEIITLIAAVVLLDLSAYAVHVLMHKVPGLWRIHRVHHSDTMVDVTTAFRQHPLETLIRFVFTAVPALLLGVPPAALALYRTLSGVSAVIEHANLRLPGPVDRLLSLVIVGPTLHKLHHSAFAVETDSNYGNIFSVFDRLFGTFTPAEGALKVTYGLEGYSDPTRQTFKAALSDPFRHYASSGATSGSQGRFDSADVLWQSEAKQ